MMPTFSIFDDLGLEPFQPVGEVPYPNPDCSDPFLMIKCDYCGWSNHCGCAPHDELGPVCPMCDHKDSVGAVE